MPDNVPPQIISPLGWTSPGLCTFWLQNQAVRKKMSLFPCPTCPSAFSAAAAAASAETEMALVLRQCCYHFIVIIQSVLCVMFSSKILGHTVAEPAFKGVNTYPPASRGGIRLRFYLSCFHFFEDPLIQQLVEMTTFLRGIAVRSRSFLTIFHPISNSFPKRKRGETGVAPPCLPGPLRPRPSRCVQMGRSDWGRAGSMASREVWRPTHVTSGGAHQAGSRPTGRPGRLALPDLETPECDKIAIPSLD